jgi:N-acetylglucosamine repressor
MPRINRLPRHFLRLINLIYEEKQVSRSQLARRTGYSNFLVSKLTEQLLKDELICESGSGESSGGRRPSLLSVNPKIGYLAGVHLGTINLRAVITDMCGNVVAWHVDRSKVDQGPEKALQHVVNVVSGLLRKADVSDSRLLGFGIGIGAVSNWQSGVALSWPKIPSWVNVPVRRMVEEKFHTFVAMDDVSRTAALAEKRFGKASDANEFIYVWLGAGTGAALFLGGKLYAGKGGFAGEFGHTSVDELGALCSCGNRGCLETLVSASAIIRQAREALAAGLSPQIYQIAQKNGGEIDLESIAQAAEANDRFCLSLLSQIGAHVAIGITNLINLLNPESVIFGGGVIKAAGKWLLPSIQRVVLERAMTNAAGQVTLNVSELKDVDWARGATLLIANHALQNALMATEKL